MTAKELAQALNGNECDYELSEFYEKRARESGLASVTRAIQAHQPSTEELQREYERGVRETKERLEREWQRLNDRVAQEADKLKAYDELNMRFQLYGDDAAKAMDEFEAFRKLGISWVRSNIKGTIERLERLDKALGGMEKEEPT